MKKRNAAMLSVICSCLFAGCGLFSPRAVQQPAGGTSNNDPLNLSSITQNTSPKAFFLGTAYEDIMNPNFKYIDFQSNAFSGDVFISRLKEIDEIYDSVTATWDTINNNMSQTYGDTGIIVYRKYRVRWKATAGDSVDSGVVQVHLQYYSANNSWTILDWNEQVQRSIFHPD